MYYYLLLLILPICLISPYIECSKRHILKQVLETKKKLESKLTLTDEEIYLLKDACEFIEKYSKKKYS